MTSAEASGAHTIPWAPRALVRAPGGVPGERSGRWWRFEDPVAILTAERPAEVPRLLAQVEEAAADGLWAVGFVSYEAAPAFDSAFATRVGGAGAGGPPAARFALFDRPVEGPAAAGDAVWPGGSGSHPVSRLTPTVSEADYLRAVERVRELIERGETYQANLTYRLRGWLETARENAPEASLALFWRLATGQGAPYAAYLDLGDGAICSASPELFFERSGRSLRCRPMKGTAARGWTPATDRAAARRLLSSPKERAENVMIVDMIRNDLGRIARPGTVRVESLFALERYPTLFQLTSEVVAQSDAPLVALFGALFPCASITGAPKVRTMEILAELETTPRGIYTGAIGYVMPGGDCRFAVAIRTARVAAPEGTRGDAPLGVEFGTGSGVVWDSEPCRELAETRTKALILTRDVHGDRQPGSDAARGATEEPGAGPRDRLARAAGTTRLLETLLWTGEGLERGAWRNQPGEPAGGADRWPLPPVEAGYVLLERHLDRLERSARLLGFAVDRARVRAHLEWVGRRLASLGGGRSWRVRLLVNREGAPETEETPVRKARSPWRVALAPSPIDGRDPRLLHKTTDRGLYARALEELSGVDDAILWNRRHELTESTVANLVVEVEGELLTPGAGCGLLPGTYRELLLQLGRIREATLSPEDLERAEGVALINSVRGWIPAVLHHDAPLPRLRTRRRKWGRAVRDSG